MKNFLINLSLIIILFASSGGYYAFAQENDLDPNVDGGISIASCISKGNIDFALFLNSIIWNDGLEEGIIEPFNDILYRNQCQAYDIAALIRQRDKIRSYVKDAFLTCNTQKLPNLRKAYYKLNAEIYYVRHVVDGGIVVNMPYDILSSRDLSEAYYYDEAKLYSEMLDNYVDPDIFTLSEFRTFYTNLQNKYNTRKEQYIVCDHPGWEAVTEKWEEFIESIGGLAPAWQDFEQGVGGRAEKISEAVEISSDYNYEDFFAGLVQVNVNDLQAREGVKEILDELDENLPEFESPTQAELWSALGTSDRRYSIEFMKKELEGRFDALYKNTSDSTIELFVDEVNDLNDILENTFNPFDSVLGCVEAMNNRQCSRSN